MGVTGLWTVVAPTARPTKLETLNRKRLAVDASIWIYQFLKAVRDKEGNALRNSHVVGFFRRVCKLLYFGVQPVFVFDGGAPILKRETVRGRARRREGRREDAVRTAGKLLAVQVARAAEEEEKRRREEAGRARPGGDEEELPEDAELVYVDEIGMEKQERQAGRVFKRKDQYHLPDLDVSIESLGAPNDPRIMSQAELEEYARQFHSGEDINLYDFSKIDFESPFFLSLPVGDRYNILNAARLRSRLRMGYSKEQLDGMFPDRMAFSRFQIERVTERNELTQRLMNINNGDDQSWDQGGRVVGEKGKEYVLVKNDGVEGGWALGVVSNKQGTQKENAIDLEEQDEDDDIKVNSEDEEEFEDVAVEGLNRIPKNWQRKKKELREVDYDVSYEDAAAQIARKRKAVYEGRKNAAATTTQDSVNIRPARPVRAANNLNDTGDTAGEDLFIPEAPNGEASSEDDLFEDVNIDVPDDDDDLQKAIAMSLEVNADSPQGGGFVQDDPDSGEDDGMDLAAALAESRKSKYKATTNIRKPASSPPVLPQTQQLTQKSKFDGPLPFESLNLGQSLLGGKKRAQQVEEDFSGGFDRSAGEDAFRKEKKAQPLPLWFDTAPTNRDQHDLAHDDDSDDHVTFGREDIDRRETLMRYRTKEVIDLDEEEKSSRKQDIVEIEDDDDGESDELAEPEDEKENEDFEMPDESQEFTQVAEEQAKKEQEAQAREARYQMAREIAAANDDETEPTKNNVSTDGQETTLMEDVADHIQASPPPPTDVPNFLPDAKSERSEEGSVHGTIHGTMSEASEPVEWSDSEEEKDPKLAGLSPRDRPAGGHTDIVMVENPAQADDDEGEAFEDVDMEPVSIITQPTNEVKDHSQQPADDTFLIPEELDPADQIDGSTNNGAGFDNYLSDSDEEIMRQLAIEAEEHARFASSLNNTRTPAQAARDYEEELKQLRNQQKRDRRDADEVTQVMIQECQALLRLFGLPYITAPMEAEAQCAELVQLGLVDGIVTDDSDIFLFGGTRIYKNMFNAAKFVECYITADLEKEYDLDRAKLIRFAHLLGSDYTEGIPGIGPVTALEIISDFENLTTFKDWCGRVQLGRPSDLDGQLTTPFRRKFHKTVTKKLFLPNGFPDLRVDEAYLKPEVDSDPQEFQWGVPDLDKLRSFLMATIGWSQERTDEILVPVIRDMNRRGVEGTQSNITRFFSGGVGVGGNTNANAASGGGTEGAPRNRTGKESGRMKNAYTRLRGEAAKKRQEKLLDQAPDSNGGVELDVQEEAATIDATDEMADSEVSTKVSKRKKSRSSPSRLSVQDEGGSDGSEFGDEDAPKKRKPKKSATKKRKKTRV